MTSETHNLTIVFVAVGWIVGTLLAIRLLGAVPRPDPDTTAGDPESPVGPLTASDETPDADDGRPHVLHCMVCGQTTDETADEPPPAALIAAVIESTRAAAFARAAQAVGLYPHRVDRRGELVQHLLSLADAPDLTAPLEGAEDDPPTSNPEPAQFAAEESQA